MNTDRIQRCALFVWALLSLALGPIVGRGQDAQEMYDRYKTSSTKGGAGVHWWIEKWQEKQQRFVAVTTAYQFRCGDAIQIHLKPNFDSYIAILNRGTNGELQRLYPLPGHDIVQHASGQTLIFPSDLDGFEFDGQRGTENLLVVFSTEPMNWVEKLATPEAASLPCPSKVPPAPPTRKKSAPQTPQPKKPEKAGSAPPKASAASVSKEEYEMIDKKLSAEAGRNFRIKRLRKDNYVVTPPQENQAAKMIVFQLPLIHQ